MKTNKLFIAALFGTATLSFQSCMGQKVNVPENVKAAIHKTYPQVKHFKWEKENGNFEGKTKEASLNKDANGKITYEADIEDGTLLFDASGHFVKKEMSEENNEKAESHEEQGED